MNADDLKPRQFETMRNELRRRMRYLWRLEERMYALGGASDDERFRLGLDANKANRRHGVKSRDPAATPETGREFRRSRLTSRRVV